MKYDKCYTLETIIEISRIINEKINDLPIGSKIDRTKLGLEVSKIFQEKIFPVDTDNVLTLLGLIIRMRNDLTVSKGKMGGTFKIDPDFS